MRPWRPGFLLGLAALGAVLAAGCYSNKSFVDFNPNVPGTKFKTIGVLAGTDAGSDIRLTAQLRVQLRQAGWNAVQRSGRWESVPEAVQQICAPGADEPVDGVLIVTYNHLQLFDCSTAKAAFEIQSSVEGGGMGLPEMTQRLMQYLQGKNPKGGEG